VKMHLTPIVLASRYNPQARNGRRLTKVPFPFQEIVPLACRNTVSGKGDKQKGVACLQEMSILFACMKKNEFRDVQCDPEITAFQNCHKDYLEKESLTKAQSKSGLLVPYERQLTHKQLNQLLKKYPQPK
ncbi:unnamed protein product, partial [Meganyctiphanes norvegica]